MVGRLDCQSVSEPLKELIDNKNSSSSSEGHDPRETPHSVHRRLQFSPSTCYLSIESGRPIRRGHTKRCTRLEEFSFDGRRDLDEGKGRDIEGNQVTIY